jgi:hypothetical protein
MGPADLLTTLYQLSRDENVQVAQAASTTAAKLPANILAGALGDALDSRVIDFFSGMVTSDQTLIEMVLLNRATHDWTFVTVAQDVSERQLEIIAANQERILRTPQIIESIYFNTQARMSTVDRLLELAVRHSLELEGIPQFKQMAKHILGGAAEEQALDLPAADALFANMLAEGGAVDESQIERVLNEAEAGRTTASEIRRQSMSAKVRLASVGSIFHRAVLIKDPNRIVALAAVGSPAVSEQEAIRYAAQRELPEEVIRYIADRRDWRKNYAIKVNLVNNPKCPLRVSMELLKQLRPTDLRGVARSKNIPGTLVQAAKHQLSQR